MRTLSVVVQTIAMASLLALVLAAMMLLSGISALAVGEYEETTMFTITVNDNSHTNFKAVQIFKGSQAVDGNDDNPLGDIVWGDNITSTLQGQIITAVNTTLGRTGANEIA